MDIEVLERELAEQGNISQCFQAQAPVDPKELVGFDRCRIDMVSKDVEERHEIGFVARADAPGNIPAAIFGLCDVRRVVRIFNRVTTRQPVKRNAAHHPAH